MRFKHGMELRVRDRNQAQWGALRGAVIGVRRADSRDVEEMKGVLLGENLVEIEISNGDLRSIPERMLEPLL